MTEMNQPENTEILKQNTETYLAERQQWIRDAVEVISDDPNADPSEVFPAATEVRADGQMPELTEEQEARLREVAGKFGVGGEADLKCGADHQLIEGGLAWKIDSEIAITDASSSLIFAGSKNRTINREDEVAYMQKRLGNDVQVGETEYDIAGQLASLQEGFEALEQPAVMPFGYKVEPGFELINEGTGQLTQIGTNNGRPVLVLRVDREDYVDEEGANKYRNQPDSAALMGFVADVLSATGDQHATVGMNTSNTYSSRVIDAVRAGLHRNREFTVGMYGRGTIASVKGEAVAEPTPLNQIPGELHTIHQKLQQLASELVSE